MAGLGRKTFVATEVLTAANVNGYLMDQTVMKYANTTAASSAVGTALSEGMTFYLSDTDEQVYHNGTTFAKQNGTTNAIINGAFDIWQRGTAAVTTSTFSADRWSFYGQGSGTGHSATRQTFTPGAAPVTGYESEFYYQDVITSGSDANTQLLMLQKIEDVRKFAGETVTMSFWAKATSGTPKIGAELYQDFGSGGSAAVSGTGQSATLSTSWARYSFTFAVPSITGKTIGTGSSLYANIWFSAGSTWNTRSGSVGLQSATFQVWGVQLEAGSVATPFKRNAPSIQAELAACQRYYQRFNSINTYGLFGFGKGYSTGVLNLVFSLPVQMRTTPNLIETSAMSTIQYETGATSGNTPTSITLNAFTSTPSIVGADLNKSASFTTGAFYFIQANNSASAYIAFGAEL